MDFKKLKPLRVLFCPKDAKHRTYRYARVGKTSTAVELSKLCGRPCVDIDAAIHDETGKTSSEILRLNYSRDIESKNYRHVGSKQDPLLRVVEVWLYGMSTTI